ncbi:hypothetical protein L0F63_006060 [Massospora cicadina]|nr:hypothetical protein L0F63_006060 [Massospora cicadina]
MAQVKLIILVHILFLLCGGDEMDAIVGSATDAIKGIVSSYDPKIDLPTIPRVTVGIALVVIGVAFMFLGKYLIKAIVFVAGGSLFGVLVYFGAALVVDMPKDQDIPQKVIVAVAIAGIFGGLIAVSFFKLGIILLGGFLGGSAAMMAVRLKLVRGKEFTMGLSVGFVTVSCILAYIFSSIIMILATSFGGALMFMVGIDFFLELGFADFITKYKFIDNLNPPNRDVGLMLGSTVLFCFISIFVQYKLLKKS